MCLNPIDIVNPTKYISRSAYADRLVLSVPCNHCAECASLAALQWNHRITCEYNDTIESGGYALFDTLTYDDVHLPYSNRYYDLPADLVFPCFDYRDIQLFLKRLRKNVGNLRYIIVSEYGQDDRYTHRPHYHAIFFVRDTTLSPLYLSEQIAKSWSNGRTDGLPFKTSRYVMSNSVLRDRIGAGRACSYVAKYIQKSSSFQKVIDSRIDSIYNYIKDPNLDDRSRFAKLLKRSIVRSISQFHRQSRYFGLSALRDVDVADLINRGSFVYQPAASLPISVPLSTYFKRHLMQELIIVDGQKMWQYTDLGLEYQKICSNRVLKDTALRLSSHLLNGSSISSAMVPALSDYLVNIRGRLITGSSDPVNFEIRSRRDLLFKYSSDLDRDHYHVAFVSSEYLGNSVSGYSDPQFGSLIIPLRDFLHSYLQNSKHNDLETLYQTYLNELKPLAATKQKYADFKEDQRNKFKCVGLVV